MAGLPEKPPSGVRPLPVGWTEHKAPTGHSYYYNSQTKQSTYVRPCLDVPQPPPPPGTDTSLNSNSNSYSVPPHQIPASFGLSNSGYRPPFHNYGGSVHQTQQNPGWQHAAPLNQSRDSHREGHQGGHRNFPDRRRQPEDRPKHRYDIPGCAPWVLVKTKLGRRFVWNKETDESFWKFPPDVMKGVVEFDRKEREKRERRERGEPSDEEDAALMAELDAELEQREEEILAQIVEVDGEEGMSDDEEYEEVEVTDDEGEQRPVESHPSKRLRTEEPADDQNIEMGEDDMAWQLAQMEAMEALEHGYEEEDEGIPLTDEDCKALFKELLDDLHISPYTPWDKILNEGILYDDERYKALPNMKSRKECFDEWSREKAQILKEQKAKQHKLDPKIPYLVLLHNHATPKLYWPEFRRKFKKEPELRDQKLADKEKERLYRDHIKRLTLKQSDLKSDLSALLKAQPLSSLNRSTTLETLPSAVLTDLRFISLPASTRDSLINAYISTLPLAPANGAVSAEEEAEAARKRGERERRERALAERERRVQDEKRKQDRDLAYAKIRLREEEYEIERAMKVGKGGLRAQLEALPALEEGHAKEKD